MSLDKAISSGKERRREWRDSRRFDPACRNHGGCPWCENNRTHQQRRLELEAHDERKEITDA